MISGVPSMTCYLLAQAGPGTGLTHPSGSGAVREAPGSTPADHLPSPLPAPPRTNPSPGGTARLRAGAATSHRLPSKYPERFNPEGGFTLGLLRLKTRRQAVMTPAGATIPENACMRGVCVPSWIVR